MPTRSIPGDTVIVQGAKAGSGTVTASSVVATASNAQGGFGALFGGGRGGGGAAGGGAPTGGFGGGAPQGAPPGGG